MSQPFQNDFVLIRPSVANFAGIIEIGTILIKKTFSWTLTFQKKFVICLIESFLKMMKNAFYFVKETLSVLKTLKFLSRLFDHVRKNGLI